jgi:hypothetical protein
MKTTIRKIKMGIVLIATVSLMSSFTAELKAQTFFVVYGFDYTGYYDKSHQPSSVIISDVVKADCDYSVGQIQSEMKAAFRAYYDRTQYKKRGIDIRDIEVQTFSSYDDAVAGKRKIIKTYEPKQLDPLQLNNFTFYCND